MVKKRQQAAQVAPARKALALKKQSRKPQARPSEGAPRSRQTTPRLQDNTITEASDGEGDDEDDGEPELNSKTRSRARPTVHAAPRLQDNARTKKSDGESEDDSASHDTLVPDGKAAKELGISVMSMWRRTNDPDDGFPAPIKISGRNFRSRRQLEAYKNRKLREAMRVLTTV